MRLSVALITAASNGLNAAVAEDADHAAALAAAHAAADKAALRLFHAACKGERPARAADVAAGLHLSNSMHGALKLANALQQPVLAQRVTGIIEASMAAAAAAEHSPTYAEPSQLDTPGQAPHAHYSAPASYAPPSQSRRNVKAEEENPFARRTSIGGGAADENDAGNVDDRAAATKTKAGFERDANPAPRRRAEPPTRLRASRRAAETRANVTSEIFESKRIETTVTVGWNLARRVLRGVRAVFESYGVTRFDIVQARGVSARRRRDALVAAPPPVASPHDHSAFSASFAAFASAKVPFFASLTLGMMSVGFFGLSSSYFLSR